MIPEFSNKHILICPLNWGLGHATRCMPLIDHWLSKKCTISIASDGIALQLLKQEYPGLHFYELPSYNIRYKRRNMYLNMIQMLPNIESGIRRENQAIQNILEDSGAEIIVSDHRYGCRNSRVPCYLIAHQIQIPTENSLAQKIATRFNKMYINHFDECWIPDREGGGSIAGKISEPNGLKQYRFIGPLSRFKKLEIDIHWDVAIILSGPEPARTIFETFLLENIPSEDLNVIFVRGTIEKSRNKLLDHFQSKDLLTSKELNEVICSSRVVICRSGYSSIMDLKYLNKPALLIPTPGQPEQEYLADYHKKKGFFMCTVQKDQSFQSAFKKLHETYLL